MQSYDAKILFFEFLNISRLTILKVLLNECPGGDTNNRNPALFSTVNYSADYFAVNVDKIKIPSRVFDLFNFVY